MSKRIRNVQDLVLAPLLGCLFLLFFVGTARPQGGIPTEQLVKLKAATVLVLVESPMEEGSGSGFLILNQDGYGYIATNEHVVDTEIKQGRRVRVVFNSGMPGTEAVLPAEVVAEDAFRDLAILRVRSTTLPEPLKLSSPQPVRETAQVWVFGFPFGEMLATSKLHPSITITTGTITSIRRDDYGKIARVQVDADINEGNSGGPIVDATGGLVGIATEKIEDTKIGLGLSPSELEEMLQGRIKELGMHPVDNRDGVATYHAVALLIDPLHRVRSVSILFIPQSVVRMAKPDEQGRYGQLSPAMREFPLALTNNEYSGPVKLDNPRSIALPYWQQVRLELANGEYRWTQPTRYLVPPSPETPKPENGRIIGGTPRSATGVAPAGDDWLGGAAAPQPGGGTAGTLAVASSNRQLLDEAHVEADAKYYVLNVGGKVLPTMQWSADAKALYLLEENGVLHKVAVNVAIPEFREEKVVSMQQKTKYMVMTRSGLAIGLPLLQEVWLFNPDTLQLLKRIPVGGMSGLASSPQLTKAFAIVEVDVLSIVDLEAGKVIKQLRAKEILLQNPNIRRDLGDFNLATISPDGQYFFTGGTYINRSRIDGDDLVYEDSTPAVIRGQNPQRLIISPDSRYVALPCGGGNNNAPGHPQVGPYATYIYRIADLKTPVLTIQAGAYPQCLGFDRVGGYIYAQGGGSPLKAFTAAGLQEKSYRLAPRASFGDGVDQFLVHPQGRKLLVLSGEKLIWVDLSAAGP